MRPSKTAPVLVLFFIIGISPAAAVDSSHYCLEFDPSDPLDCWGRLSTEVVEKVDPEIDVEGLVGYIKGSAPCSRASDYHPEDIEYAQSWGDDGTAVFHSAVPSLSPYDGAGGHHGEVWGCWADEGRGGYLPVVSDFHWSGGTSLGFAGGITIHSAGAKTPVVYSTASGKANAMFVASSESKTVEGEYFAEAIHGGILVPKSSGFASIRADVTLLAYGYDWNYEGVGSPVDMPGECEGNPCLEDLLLLPVYGAGSDADLVT